MPGIDNDEALLDIIDDALAAFQNDIDEGSIEPWLAYGGPVGRFDGSEASYRELVNEAAEAVKARLVKAGNDRVMRTLGYLPPS